MNFGSQKLEPRFKGQSVDSPGSEEIGSVNSINIDTNHHQVTDYRQERGSSAKASYQERRRTSKGSRGSNNSNSRGRSKGRSKSNERDLQFEDLAESRFRNSKDYEQAVSRIKVNNRKSRESIKDQETNPTFRDPELGKSSVPFNESGQTDYFKPLKEKQPTEDSFNDDVKSERPYECDHDLLSSNKRLRH